MTTLTQADVIVIGAGLSGLLAARKLDASGYRVVVLETDSGRRWRLATYRMDEAVFDHGAQYFTVLDPAFDNLVQDWQERRLVRLWATGFTLPDGTLKRDGQERFCCVSGMSGLARHLAEKLDVRLNAAVAHVAAESNAWKLTVENAEPFAGRALLLTPPVPQSLISRQWEALRPLKPSEGLLLIEYYPCLALLVYLSRASMVPDPEGSGFPAIPLLDRRQSSQTNIPGIQRGTNDSCRNGLFQAKLEDFGTESNRRVARGGGSLVGDDTRPDAFASLAVQPANLGLS